MGAEVHHGVGLEVFTQVAIEGGKGMGGRHVVLKEQAHGVAFHTKARLHQHRDIPKVHTQHKEALAIGELPTRRRPPAGLDVLEPDFFLEMVLHRDARQDIGIGAMGCAIAIQELLTNGIARGGKIDLIALPRHAL